MNPCQYEHDHLCSGIDWTHNTIDDRYIAESHGMQFVLWRLEDPTHPWAIAGRYAGSEEWTLGMKYDTPHHALLQAASWAITLGGGELFEFVAPKV